MKRPAQFVVTCEHAGNEIPDRWRHCFTAPLAQKLLAGHRGYDPGALAAALQISASLGVACLHTTVSRLLVEANRSEDSPELLSRFTRDLKVAEKQKILSHYYRPFRNQVLASIAQAIEQSRQVVHLSIHTFTPRYRGTWRKLDVGILFNPDRHFENAFASDWIEQFRERFPSIRIAANQPYAGTDDGHTTALRKSFLPQDYLGLEVEINHRYFHQSRDRQATIVDRLLGTLPRSIPK